MIVRVVKGILEAAERYLREYENIQGWEIEGRCVPQYPVLVHTTSSQLLFSAALSEMKYGCHKTAHTHLRSSVREVREVV